MEADADAAVEEGWVEEEREHHGEPPTRPPPSSALRPVIPPRSSRVAPLQEAAHPLVILFEARELRLHLAHPALHALELEEVGIVDREGRQGQ